MTIHILERPETLPELAAWLERHLVGHTLGELVAELSVFAENDRTAPPLETLIDVDSVLKQGLKGLSAEELQLLLQNPTRLFDLQERIFIDGGDYWNQVPRSQEIVAGTERVFQKMHKRVQPTAVVQRANWRFLVSGLAALFLFGLMIGWLIPRGHEQPGFAWTKPGAFRPAATRQEFLNRLATLANDWFAEEPKSPEVLAARIIEFRRGCMELQLHAQEIPEQDRQWLLEACRNWSSKLDSQLAQVEDLVTGKSERSFSEIRTETDDIIRKLITRLNNEAKA